MKILVTIPHFYQPSFNPRYSSRDINAFPRLKALAANITALQQQFSQGQAMINISQKLAVSANQSQTHQLDIIICTTGDSHLLPELNLPPYYYHHHSSKAEPMLLGFESQAVLKEHLGKYDYYCYLEDDLIIHDPWFFNKLNWFTQHLGNECLLQPHRYEIAIKEEILKAYIDGDLHPRATERFQNIQEKKILQGDILGNPVRFSRTLNPHSGCYFLNQQQMEYWTKQPYFLDRDVSFIGPLESAATLGIMKTFRIYKTTSDFANFLEIQHYGEKFLNCIGRQVQHQAV